MKNVSGVPQLVLQPRGSAKDRGPQNYKDSVEQGIRLRDVAAELGPDLAAFTALYPDGVARLWGSTPTNQVNNYKARALRDRRVGDDVLLRETAFYARARILNFCTTLLRPSGYGGQTMTDRPGRGHDGARRRRAP